MVARRNNCRTSILACFKMVNMTAYPNLGVRDRLAKFSFSYYLTQGTYGPQSCMKALGCICMSIMSTGQSTELTPLMPIFGHF